MSKKGTTFPKRKPFCLSLFFLLYLAFRLKGHDRTKIDTANKKEVKKLVALLNYCTTHECLALDFLFVDTNFSLSDQYLGFAVICY